MSTPAMKGYPAEFKERAVKLAVESDQPIAQTARDLGVNENTLHTWIGKYHRAVRQEKEVHDEHLYEELKHLRKENARILLVNPLHSSRSTFSWGSLLSFFAFQEGMLGTPISVLGG
jgi:transposase